MNLKQALSYRMKLPKTGHDVRKQSVINSVCNKSPKRCYIPLCDFISDKDESERLTLALTGGFFKKIISTKDVLAPYHSYDSAVMNVYNFLLNGDTQENQVSTKQ